MEKGPYKGEGGRKGEKKRKWEREDRREGGKEGRRRKTSKLETEEKCLREKNEVPLLSHA